MFNSNFGRCPILISRPFAKLEWVLLTSKLQTSPVPVIPSEVEGPCVCLHLQGTNRDRPSSGWNLGFGRVIHLPGVHPKGCKSATLFVGISDKTERPITFNR